jgi:hypothetical protein
MSESIVREDIKTKEDINFEVYNYVKQELNKVINNKVKKK